MILGHQKQWQFLKGLIKLGNIPHAFLFSGPSEIGKKTLAMEFLKLLNCEKSKGFSCQNCRSCKDIEKKVHPDVRILEHQEKDINIDQIRELKSYLSLSPHSAIFKSVIIDQAHSLNRQAQSALLKLLEEPKGKTIFILITEYPEMLLDTILSRCEILKFYLVSDKEIKDYLKNQKIPEKAQERLLSMSFG
ncbi:MAG TPA: DNA polymerase III subunit delta', partial [bacterium]|nr:DNA polymerase III subunit delta' [bacterium]